jgi:hypothetical protein
LEFFLFAFKEHGMKRLLFLTLAFLLVISLNPPQRVHGAVSTTWSAVIEYYNPTDENNQEISIIYYTTAGGFTQSDPLTVNAHQAGTILVGQVGAATTFTGSAVISATVPLLSVYKQVSNTRDAFSPLLYTSFDIDEAGSGEFFIPTVRRVGGYDSQIAIQNVESTTAADMTVTFYNYNTGTPAVTCNFANVPALSAKIFKLSEVGSLAGCVGSISAGFDGSVVIGSQKDDAAGDARVIAVVQETEAGGRRAYAFEGIKAGATDVFMPTGMCKYGSTQQTTYFAIQNADTLAADVDVEYYNAAGVLQGKQSLTNILAGAKVSLSSCECTTVICTATTGTFLGNVTGKNLSVRIVSTNGRQVAAVGKVMSTDGLMTAYTGRPAPSGSGPYTVVLPYVEWSASSLGYRTYMAVMNASDTTPAADVTATFYNPNGELVRSYNLATGGTYVIQPYAKRSFDPSIARALTSGMAGSFKGAVVISSDQPIVVLARVQRGVSGVKGITTLGEDYTGVLYTP